MCHICILLLLVVVFGTIPNNCHLLFSKAIADACKVSATFKSVLDEPEMPNECEKQFDEDQELQQIIDGKLCMKIYHFSCGIVTSPVYYWLDCL